MSSDGSKHETKPEDIVPLPSKLAYGAGAFVNNLLSAAIGNMMIVLNLGFGMNPALVGALGGLPRIIDAVTDPLMGHISDNTRSRWGRRRPYIFVGAILVSVAFVLLWQLPVGDSHVVAWTAGGPAQQWNADEGTPIGAAMRHDASVAGAAFPSDSSRVLTWSDDGSARLWDPDEGAPIGAAMRHDGPVAGAAFRDGEILTWSDDGTARLWDAETGAPAGEPLRHGAPVVGAATHAAHVLTWGSDGTARLWDAETGASVGAPMPHDSGAVSGAAVQGERLLTWDRSSGAARLWDAEAGAPIATLQHGEAVGGGLFFDDARIVTWGGSAARLWDAETGASVGAVMQHDGGAVSGAAAFDGDRLLTWGSDGTARLWDAETGAPAGAVMRHGAAIGGALVDDARIVTWGGSTARLWDAEAGVAIGAPMAHGGAVGGAVFDRVRTRILTWSDDGATHLWGARDAEAIAAPIVHDGPVLGAVFNDGHMEDFYFYWFLIGSVIFFLSYTMWATPWVALGFELTPDYYERTRLMGVQFFIGQIPYLIAPWFLAFMTWSYFASQAQGASVLALLVGLTAVTLGVIPALFLRERPLPPAEEPAEGEDTGGGFVAAITGFGTAMVNTMTSKPFLLLCAATFLVFNGFQLIGAFQSYVLIYYVMGGDQEGGSFWLGWTGTCQIIATFGVIPFVTWLANRIGKRRAFLVATGIATAGYGLKWFCYSPELPWLILLPTPLIAFSLGGLFTLMPSMIADVVDHDELRTHERREGMFGSVYWLMVKLGVSAALIAGGVLLNETGFRVELGAEQPAETLLWLRIYDVIVPMGTSLLAMLAMYFYPLVESRALEIRAELDARHAAAAAAASDAG